MTCGSLSSAGEDQGRVAGQELLCNPKIRIETKNSVGTSWARRRSCSISAGPNATSPAGLIDPTNSRAEEAQSAVSTPA